MKRQLLLFIISLTLCIPHQATAQDNFGFNFIFMTIHPGGNKMYFLQPNRLDDKARFVLNWGGVAHYERFIFRKRLSIKFAQAFYSDCAAQFAGHTHLAFRLNVLNSESHSLRLGFGPTWVYRRSWRQFPEYEQENQYLRDNGNYQTTFVWYGGEIEYDYKIADEWEVNFHVIPGVPDFFTLGVGFRYWLHPIPSGKDWKNHPKKNKWFYTNKDVQMN